MTLESLSGYDRQKALDYSYKWAMGRNPAYLNFDKYGGDCTNFISQCIYAGCGIMNYTPTYGWYYKNGNDKAPAWTGVQYLYNFLTRKDMSPGPYGREAGVAEIEPGDIIQLSFQDSGNFSHSLFVVQCGSPAAVYNILINTHTYDRLNYQLNRYFWSRIRFIKILGARK